MKPLARGFLHRFGFRRLLIVNGVLASPVLLASALFTPATPHLVIIGVLLCGGFLRSLQFTSLSAITYAEVESRQVGSATGMASVGAAGVGELRRGGRRHGAWRCRRRCAGTRRRRPRTSPPRSWSVGLMSMASALLMLRLPADAGDEISGPRGAGARGLERARGPGGRRLSAAGDEARARSEK